MFCGIRLKQVLQREPALFRRQILGRLRSHLQKRILRGARNIILNLRDQRWHQVEGLMDVGKLVQQFHHAVIVFQRMQAHPRQAIFACDQILVKGLVLVPKNDDAKSGHAG